MKLGCTVCGDLHKASDTHFPFIKYAEREKDGKQERYIDGRVCVKCIRKHLKVQNVGKI